jgi:hypothetical protein
MTGSLHRNKGHLSSDVLMPERTPLTATRLRPRQIASRQRKHHANPSGGGQSQCRPRPWTSESCGVRWILELSNSPRLQTAWKGEGRLLVIVCEHQSGLSRFCCGCITTQFLPAALPSARFRGMIYHLACHVLTARPLRVACVPKILRGFSNSICIMRVAVGSLR